MSAPLKNLWLHLAQAQPNRRPVFRSTRTALVVLCSVTVWGLLGLFIFLVWVVVRYGFMDP